MAIASLTRALQILHGTPVLWLPGLVAGLLAAGVWLALTLSGTFFAGRLLVFAGLIAVFFITGTFGLIKAGSNDLASLVRSGMQYYFRVLLPGLVIVFVALLVALLVGLTLSLVGSATDPALIADLAVAFLIPTLLLTFFADTAAVFEDQRVFAAIRRSILLVSANLLRVIGFFAMAFVVSCAITFSLMMVWTAFLADKLEPLTTWTVEQQQAATPQQMLALIGTDGIWVTAGVLVLAGLLLVPVLVSYKACFFKTLAGSAVIIEQTTGEYDSKGRWYKY